MLCGDMSMVLPEIHVQCLSIIHSGGLMHWCQINAISDTITLPSFQKKSVFRPVTLPYCASRITGFCEGFHAQSREKVSGALSGSSGIKWVGGGILWNHSYSWGPMFVECQNFAGSYGFNLVGNWFVASQCKTIFITLLKYVGRYIHG